MRTEKVNLYTSQYYIVVLMINVKRVHTAKTLPTHVKYTLGTVVVKICPVGLVWQAYCSTLLNIR